MVNSEILHRERVKTRERATGGDREGAWAQTSPLFKLVSNCIFVDSNLYKIFECLHGVDCVV